MQILMRKSHPSHFQIVFRHVAWGGPKCVSLSAVFLHKNIVRWLGVQGELPWGICPCLTCQGIYKFTWGVAPWVEDGWVSQTLLNSRVLKWKGEGSGSRSPTELLFFSQRRLPVVLATFALSGMPEDGFLGKGASGVPGSLLSLAVGLLWSLTQNHPSDWEGGGMEGRMEGVCFHFPWLVFLWHSSQCETESDHCLFKVSSVHCGRYSSRKEWALWIRDITWIS